MKICSQCGNNINEGDKVCGACYTRLSGFPTPRNKTLRMLVSFLLALFVGVPIGGVFFGYIGAGFSKIGFPEAVGMIIGVGGAILTGCVVLFYTLVYKAAPTITNSHDRNEYGDVPTEQKKDKF